MYFPDTVSSFYERYKSVNLCLVNDGKFLPELARLENIAKEKTLIAKENEVYFSPDDENSHKLFRDAVSAYEEVLNHIKKHNHGLANAEQITKRNSSRENIRSWKFTIIGAILGVIGTLIIQNWNKITPFIASIFQSK